MSKKETKEVKEEVKVSDTTPVKTEGEFKIKSAKKMKSLGEKDEMKPIRAVSYTHLTLPTTPYV